MVYDRGFNSFGGSPRFESLSSSDGPRCQACSLHRGDGGEERHSSTSVSESSHRLESRQPLGLVVAPFGSSPRSAYQHSTLHHSSWPAFKHRGI
jgi:hypothetical protein